LTKQSDKEFEVIIIDGGSTDATKRVASEFEDRLSIRFFVFEEKELAKVRDLGWRKARGELVSWIDDDVVVSPDWAKSIIEIFKDSQIGGVSGPTIIPPKILKQRDIFFFYNKGGFNKWLGVIWNKVFLENGMYQVGRVFRSGAWSPGSNFQSCLKLNGLIDVDYLEACNMTVRRDLVKRVGGFDFDYRGVAEWCELDLAQKVKALGYRLIFSTKVRVDHFVSQGGVYTRRTDARERMENFLRYYFRFIYQPKWGHIWRFGLYLFFLNGYWVYKTISTGQVSWLGGVAGTFRMFSLRKLFWLTQLLTNFGGVKSTFINWQEFYADCFGLVKNKQTVYQTRTGAKYMVRSGSIDLGILDEILIRKIYFPPFLDPKLFRVVLDVGAHIGVFALKISELVHDDCRIYALEPERENHALLSRNIKLNKKKNIIALNYAVAGSAGNRYLRISSNNPAAHSFYFGSSNKLSRQIVKTVTLKKIIEDYKLPHIDLLKLDCEGAEYEILLSCSPIIMSKIDGIVMEYHRLDENHDYRQLIDYLKKNGFKIHVKKFPDGLIYAYR
jgi:FkbM family methyltransferase